MHNIISAPRKPLPLLTLHEWTVIKLSTTLSNHQRLLNKIIDLEEDVDEVILYAKNGKEWKDIHSLANELLSEISISNKFKEIIIESLWTVSYRLILWKSTYAPAIEKELFPCFHWTGRGKIDSKRTARLVLGNKNIPARDRFRFACSLGLPEDIQEVWQEMSYGDRDFFQKKNHETLRPLLLFWVHSMNKCHCFREHRMIKALECSISLGLSEATKYLLNLLPECLKNDIAILCEDVLKEKVNNMAFLEEDEIQIGYLIFSYMWYRNQVNVMNFNSGLTLLLLLHSSERELFLQELKSRLPFISLNAIRILLYNIYLNYHLEIKKDHDYFALFVDVWRIIPVGNKNSMIANINLEMQFLSIMIKGEFQYLLERENSDELDSSNLDLITPFCFSEDKWEFLYFFIEEGIVTISSLTRCKSVFLNFLQEKKIPEFLKNSLKNCK